MKKILVIFLLSFGVNYGVFSQEKARVIKVLDGDSYVLLSHNKKHYIRLLNVDSPEMKQHWGINSKNCISELILGKDVEFETIKRDLYGRELANIKLNGQRVDSLMIANGWAWYYSPDRNKSNLNELMLEALKNRKGMWDCDFSKICPPWLFRKFNTWNRNKYCRGCINNNYSFLNINTIKNGQIKWITQN